MNLFDVTCKTGTTGTTGRTELINLSRKIGAGCITPSYTPPKYRGRLWDSVVKSIVKSTPWLKNPLLRLRVAASAEQGRVQGVKRAWGARHEA